MDSENKFIRTIFWWVSAILLFIVVYATAPRLFYVTAVLFNQLKGLGIQLDLSPTEEKARFLREVVAPIKGLMFLLALAGLLPPLVRDIWNSAKTQPALDHKRLLWTSLFYLAIVTIFITPNGLSGGNLEYADQSGVVFEKGNDVWLYQRFLMPAVAYVLFFRGQFFYLLFSYICIYAMIYVAQVWLERNEIKLKHWQLISLFTAGFVFVKIQYPGSPDVFVHLFLLLLFAFPLGEAAQLSLVAFSLASHEAAVFLFAAIGLFFKEGNLRLKYLGLISAYLLIWMVSLQFDIASLWTTPQVRGLGALSAITSNPSLLFWGLFHTNRMAWIFILTSMGIVLQRKDYRTLLQFLALIGCGILMSLIGVDTIRMFSWSFFTIFMALKVIKDENNPRLLLIVSIALALNFLLPPLYSDLHGVRQPSGVYGLILSLFGS